MARVALGRPLYNPVEIRDGTTSYVPCPFFFGLRAESAPLAVDTSLPASEIIADSVRRSSRAHVFHFYALLCEIVSVPRKAPSAWVTAERLAPGGRSKDKKDDSPIAVRVHHPLGHVAMGAGNGSDTGRLVSLDARALARECLKEVGRELGVPR